MKDVILFPRSKETKPPPKNLDLTSPKCRQDKLYTGPWSLTCPDCGNIAEFTSTGMIFREMYYYCEKCGSYHKVVNPAFSI